MRVSVLVAVPDVLREHGCGVPDAVVRRAGVEPALLDDPDNLIPFATAGRLATLCAAETRCPHFGLMIGERSTAASLGAVGLLLRQAVDVGTALGDLVRYLHLHDRGAVPTLTVADGRATLAYAIYEPNLEGADQIADGAAAIAFNILRELCGPQWLPGEVRLPHRRPADAAPYARLFRAPLVFDAEEMALDFPAHWLARPVAGADPARRRMIEAFLRQVDSASDRELPDRMRRVLRTLLTAGRCTADDVAQLFSVHRRTLNRRLKRAGTGFHTLIEETRFQIARQLIGDTDLPLAQIAAALNYSEASAFTRAFRRWSGLAPAEWRAQRKAGSEARA